MTSPTNRPSAERIAEIRKNCERTRFHTDTILKELMTEIDHLQTERDAWINLATERGRLGVELQKERNALREQVRGLSEALEKIDDEPNQIGPEADEMVENYGVKAWSIAHSALAKCGAKDEGEKG